MANVCPWRRPVASCCDERGRDLSYLGVCQCVQLTNPIMGPGITAGPSGRSRLKLKHIWAIRTRLRHDPWRRPLPEDGKLVEGDARPDERGVPAGRGLPATDRDRRVFGLQLGREGAADPLRGQDRGPRGWRKRHILARSTPTPSSASRRQACTQRHCPDFILLAMIECLPSRLAWDTMFRMRSFDRPVARGLQSGCLARFVRGRTAGRYGSMPIFAC